MTRFVTVIESENRPEWVPSHTYAWTLDDAARNGADLVSEFADRVVTTRSDLNRWANTLMKHGRIEFDDEMGWHWTIRLIEVTA